MFPCLRVEKHCRHVIALSTTENTTQQAWVWGQAWAFCKHRYLVPPPGPPCITLVSEVNTAANQLDLSQPLEAIYSTTKSNSNVYKQSFKHFPIQSMSLGLF
jgi:hypothetical protein